MSTDAFVYHERKVLQFTRRPVAQQDLDMLAALDDQIRSLQFQRNAKCAEVLEQVMHGAPVEAGEHTVAVQEQVRGPNRIFRLILDGHIIR